MGHAAGLAYTDRGVKADQHYLYDLRGVLADGSERVLAIDVPIWAGHFILPAPPSGLAVQVGDRRALVLWNRIPNAATYVVQRADDSWGAVPGGDRSPVAYDVSEGLDGQPVGPQPGFLDVCAFDPDGVPTSHLVEGVRCSARTTEPPTSTGWRPGTTWTEPERGAVRWLRLRSGLWHRWPPTTWPCHRRLLQTGWSSRGGP